jgi:hypothetical protein
MICKKRPWPILKYYPRIHRKDCDKSQISLARTASSNLARIRTEYLLNTSCGCYTNLPDIDSDGRCPYRGSERIPPKYNLDAPSLGHPARSYPALTLPTGFSLVNNETVLAKATQASDRFQRRLRLPP